MKLNTKVITDAITKAFSSIVEDVNNNADTDKDKDKSKDKKFVLQIDEEKLAKSIKKNLNISEDEDDDDDDESSYVDEYDEMSEAELKKSCTEKKITVFSKTTPELMKKKLRDYDVAHVNDKDEDDKDEDDKDDGEKSLVDKQAAFQKAMNKTIKDLGLNPSDIKVEIVSKKKSNAKDIKDDKHKTEDDNVNYKDADAPEFAKAFSELKSEDKDEAMGDYIFQIIKGGTKKRKVAVADDDEDDE